MKLINLFIYFTTVQNIQCLKILGVFPTQAKSHYFLASSLMKGLAEKGHEVTVISPFGEKNIQKNGTYKDIILTGIAQSKENPDKLPNLFDVDNMNFIMYQMLLNFFGIIFTQGTLSDSKVQSLLKSDEKFDVVVLEQFNDDGLKVLAYHYQVPLVLFSTCGSNSWINPLVGNPGPPSYVPEHNIKFDFNNFFDRVRNAIIYVYGELYRHFIFFPTQNKIMKKYFPDAPDLDVLNYNVSLVLLNSHLSTNMAVPRVPNMIDIGGFHLKPPKKLPKDLQGFLDSAKEGVIYFSMGSSLESTQLPLEKRDVILKVFSKLKYQVLWKWEDDVLPGQPPNVKLAKWLPQQDILAHPNIKAFITHGGLLSLTETTYHGVPVLTIPVYGDQVWNAIEFAKNGGGRYILYRELNEKTFGESLNDVITNPIYRNSMKRRSRIFHDRRHKPIDDADYWIQYVVRHQGAPHLRVAGVQLRWYQYLSLDVAAFILGVIAVIFYVVVVVFKFIFRLVRRKLNVKKRKTT